MEEWNEPELKEITSEEYEIQAALENTLAYKQAKVYEAAYQFGKAFGEWANKALEIINAAIQPLLKAINGYTLQQQMMKDARADGFGRIAHLAEHSKKYRIRKKI